MGQLAISYHWCTPRKASVVKLRQIQQISSSSCAFYIHDEILQMKRRSWRNYLVFVLTGKKKRSSDKFTLEIKFIIVSFAAQSSKEQPRGRSFVRICARNLRYILCVFMVEKILFWKGNAQLALCYWLFSQVDVKFKQIFQEARSDCAATVNNFSWEYGHITLEL